MAVDTTTIGSGLESARAQIAGAIKNAASATGASFEYLISAAKIESNLNPKASGVDVVGAGAVSVHRADLARDRERGGNASSVTASMPMSISRNPTRAGIR
jgi:hypothetical protein